MHLPHHPLEHLPPMDLKEPLQHPRILLPNQRMHDHDAKHHRARREVVRDRDLVAHEVLAPLEVGLEQREVGVQRAQAVLRVLLHGDVQAEEGQDDAADGGEEVAVGEGEPFLDLRGLLWGGA